MLATLVLIAMSAKGEVDPLYKQLVRGDPAAWHEAAVRLRWHGSALAKIAAGLKSGELAPEHARVAARLLVGWSVPYTRMQQEAPDVAALLSAEVEKAYAIVAEFEAEPREKTLDALEPLGECAAPAVQRLLESSDPNVKRSGIARAGAYPVLEDLISHMQNDTTRIGILDYDVVKKGTIGDLARRVSFRNVERFPPIKDFGADLLIAVAGANNQSFEADWWEAARPQWQKWWQAKCSQPPLLRPPPCR
jgi:hypothetical protein